MQKVTEFKDNYGNIHEIEQCCVMADAKFDLVEHLQNAAYNYSDGVDITEFVNAIMSSAEERNTILNLISKFNAEVS